MKKMRKMICALLIAMLSLTGTITAFADMSAGLDSELAPYELEDIDYSVFQEYLLAHTEEGKNCAFSPVSFNTALTIYRALVLDGSADAIDEFLHNRPYLSYEETEACKSVNRLWINQNKPFALSDEHILNSIAYYMDMSDSGEATAEKDYFVAEQTDRFITSTPTILNDNTVFDAMNILYFFDTWKDGDKDYVIRPEGFYNADGTVSEATLFYEYGGYYIKGENSKAYEMKYDSDYYFVVVLPDEGVELADVDLNAYMNYDYDKIEYLPADVYCEVPEFDISSEYSMTLGDFNLEEGFMDPDIYTGETAPPEISQVIRIKVDHEGTEAAAVTEILVAEGAALEEEEEEHIDIICNRPFLFFIRDVTNDDVLFMGVINEIR